MKRSLAEQKTFAKDTPDTELMSKMQKKEKEKKSHIPNKRGKKPTHKLLNQKMGRKSEQTFFQRTHTGSQHTHEKMFNIANYQRKGNQMKSNQIK